MNYTRPQILAEKKAHLAIQSHILKHDDTVDSMTNDTRTTPAAYEADE
jgi:hypothetical protein